MLAFSILIALILSEYTASADGWNYDFQGKDWGESFPNCDGIRQSPIDIQSEAVLSAHYLSPFFFSEAFYRPVQKATLSNTGHGFKVSVDGNGLNMGGGGLTHRRYELLQFHAHWGDHTRFPMGSEHTVDKRQYPAEFHFVFKSKETSTLAVLGFFVELSDIAAKGGLGNLIDLLAQTKFDKDSSSGSEDGNHDDGNEAVDSSVDISNHLKMSDLIPIGRNGGELDGFYRYSGSLTTPPCNEIVEWTVFHKPIFISLKQYEKISECCLDTTGEVTQNNFRPTQPLNGREVFTSLDSDGIPVWL